MANRIVKTGFCRVSFPHLDKPHVNTSKPSDTPKYAISMLFPKTGITTVTGRPTSSWQMILDALNEVCMEEFKVDFNTITSNPAYGIQYPPKFKDGDLNFMKDENDNPILGSVRQETAGMWILSAKNVDPVDCVDPSGKNSIAPTAIYAGCWVRCQLEISAYTGKSGRVIVAKLLNVQKAYDDVAFATGSTKQSATEAFANDSIDDTNIPAGADPIAYGGVPAIGGPLAAPAAQKIYVHTCPQFTKAQYVGWTDDQLVAGGKGRWDMPAPAAPAAAPGMPPAPGAAPAAPAAPAVNNDPVVMVVGELPYASYVTAGWTAQQLIAAGKAVPNYLQPAG